MSTLQAYIIFKKSADLMVQLQYGDIERFKQLDWPPVERERIAAFVKRWQARLVMDATGVGDPVFDDLRRVLPLVERFKITAQTKRERVQGLMVAVEQRRVMWLATGMS